MKVEAVYASTNPSCDMLNLYDRRKQDYFVEVAAGWGGRRIQIVKNGVFLLLVRRQQQSFTSAFCCSSAKAW